MKRILKKYYLIIKKILFDGKSLHKTALIRNSTILKYAAVGKNATVLNSKIAEYSSVGRYTNIINCEIGKFCSISWNVSIGATSHPMSHLTTHAFPYISNFGISNEDKRIVVKTAIGNDVWIATNVVIMPGVKIGNGAVIGAGAIVTKDVPPYAIVVGVPAKVNGFRFEEKMIARLEKLKWWDLPEKDLKNNIDLFRKDFSSEDLLELEKICK